MSMDNTIFGLRFGSTAEISPSQEELDAFLRSPKKSGRKELHRHDTAAYSGLLQKMRTIGQRAGAEADLREKMLYHVLRHSCFVNLALKSAVEHYKYHRHALMALDFKKPTAFIAAAEAEMGRLSPRKREDSAKVARLWTMVEDRKKTLAALSKRREALIGEQIHIARYIRDNLAKIEKLCETAIVVLVNVGLGRSEEGRMVEKMREQFKEDLRDYQDPGPMPRTDLGTAGNDIDELSIEMYRLFREDVYALATLYETVHDHVQKAAREIDALLAQAKNKKDRDGLDEAEVCVRIEEVLVSLVSNFRVEVEPAEIRAVSSRKVLLQKMRNEMIGRLFELLQQERRKRVDRRKLIDRRRSRDQRYQGVERRSGQERRSGKIRRKT